MNTEWTTTQRDLPPAEVKKVAVDEFTVLGLSDGGAHCAANCPKKPKKEGND